jgi:hypothetical protein
MTPWIKLFFVFLTMSLMLLTSSQDVMAYEGQATNTQPLSFGFDQALIDLNRLEWGPLEHEGVPPGPEIAVLRGDMKTGPVEAVVRLPANYTFPLHSHTSDETYLWLTGDFTYVAEDGTAVDLGGQTFISLPGSVLHALVCKEQPCLFYLRYGRTFNMKIHSMPKLKKVSLEKEEKK